MFDEKRVEDLYKRTFGQTARSICVVSIDGESSAREVAASLVLQGRTTSKDTILVDIVDEKVNRPETSSKPSPIDYHFSRLEPDAITSIKASDKDVPLNDFFDGPLKQYDQFVVALSHGHNSNKIGSTLKLLGDFDGVILTVSDSEHIRHTLPATIRQLKRQNIKVAGLFITPKNEPKDAASKKRHWPQVAVPPAWRTATLHFFGLPTRSVQN